MDVRYLVRHSRELFRSEFVPDRVNRANRKKWVRMILWLGDRWLLANKVERRS